MHYTIINLTRFGDLLQTACTISALKKSGGHSISLICLKQFAEATKFIPDLDHVSSFSGANYLKDLQKGNFDEWTRSYQDLRDWVIRYHEEFQPDCIINLTPTLKTRMLTHLLCQYGKKGKDKIKQIGFCVNELGYNYNTNAWTSYTQAVTQNRGGSPYNLIDEFRTMLDLSPEQYHLQKPAVAYSQNAQKILQKYTYNFCEEFSYDFEDVQGFVGFQLGASNSIRQWSLENFAELAALVWEKKNFIPVILGTKNEMGLVQKFSQMLAPDIPYLDYCGKSNLLELGAMLGELTALVSNDTGTLHLATGLGIPVVGIYLATAQVWDTGPYGDKQICLEPDLSCHPCNFQTVCQKSHICQKIISAQSVYAALCYRLGLENICLEQEKPVRVWEAFFQDDGFINYKALHKEQDIRALWMQCQRIFYKKLLARLDRQEEETENFDKRFRRQEHLANFARAGLVHTPDKLAQARTEMEKLQAFLLLAREQAVLLLKIPTQRQQEKFLSSTERIKLFLKQSQFFIPLSLLFEQLLQDNAESMDAIIHFFDILKEELKCFADFLSE